MNIGLLIRGAKAGAKLAGRAAKATGRGAKAGAKAAGRGAKGAAKATGAKAKGAAKAVGKSRVAQGAKRVGGKVVEGVGYASTPGLRKSGGRYFKKKGTGAIKSIAKAKVKRTGKQVTAGASALAAGGETARRKSKSNKQAAAAKAKRDAAAARARSAVSKPKPKAKTKTKTPRQQAGAVKKALPAFARLGGSSKPIKKITAADVRAGRATTAQYTRYRASLKKK